MDGLIQAVDILFGFGPLQYLIALVDRGLEPGFPHFHVPVDRIGDAD